MDPRQEGLFRLYAHLWATADCVPRSKALGTSGTAGVSSHSGPLLFLSPVVKDIRGACARNNNPRAKPKSSDTKSNLIFMCAFADFL